MKKIKFSITMVACIASARNGKAQDQYTTLSFPKVEIINAGELTFHKVEL